MNTDKHRLDDVELLMSKGRYDESLAVLDSVLLAGADGRASYLRGVCYHRTCLPAARVFAEYDVALRSSFDPFPVLLHRGVQHAWGGAFALALADFSAALQLRPDDSQARGYVEQATRVLATPVFRRVDARYLYFAPVHCPHLDPLWLETCSIPQSTQFMIDCLPAIRQLTAGWPYDSVLSAIDVGTATGAGAALLAKFYSAGFFGFRMKVDAIDLSGQYLAYAREVFPELNYVVGDFFQYELGKQWDLVYCSHTIEHIWDPWPWVEQVRRRARKWAMFYCPFEEKNLIPGHRLSITRSMIEALRPELMEVIDSPAWKHPVDEQSRAVLFVLKGEAA